MAFTLTEAQRLLLGLITSVESGLTSPEEAVVELRALKTRAVQAGIRFEGDYSLADFQRVRRDSSNTIEYEESVPYVETSYETSESYQ